MAKTFRGGVEPLKSGHNYPFTAARMTISPDQIDISRLIGRDRRITKDSSLRIDIEKKRNPLQWATIVTLRFVEDGKEKQLFIVPFLGKACTEELRSAGWLGN